MHIIQFWGSFGEHKQLCHFSVKHPKQLPGASCEVLTATIGQGPRGVDTAVLDRPIENGVMKIGVKWEIFKF